jgi:DNA (cytosine-5)-methyltransferase 1
MLTLTDMFCGAGGSSTGAIAAPGVEVRMAFPHEYVILGTRREQVRMAGNAVTPPAARDLVTTVAATLNGAAA